MTFRFNRTLLITTAIVLAVLLFAANNMRPAVLASVLLSGLTLGALYFLVTAGLSLIFGLMDVLNFAHGVLFMLGAYVGFTLYQNPRTILNIAPLFMALAAGISLTALTAPRVNRASLTPNVRRLIWVVLLLLSLAVVAFGFSDFPLGKLLTQSATATGGAVATAVAQESDDLMLRRMAILFIAGLVFSPLMPRRKSAVARPARTLATTMVLSAIAAIIVFTRTPLEALILALATDLRFVLAIVMGALAGALVGATMEFGLI
ncbi:MAG: branched-chain amino acid ABC transporter permease, partial [Chloroflexi bacterium]|nr:branched-chain amino acid ABC transporter permease [Chloroflexota bacterium]